MIHKWGKMIEACFFVFCLLLAAGCGSSVSQDTQVITRSTLDSDEVIQPLLECNGTLIGDSTTIRTMLKDILPGKVSVVSYDIVLNRLTIEYGPTAKEEDQAAGGGESAQKAEDEEIRLNADEFAKEWDAKTTKEIIFYNTSSLFALIPNLESVQYLVEGYNLPTFTISRANMEEFFRYPLSDIDTISAWRNKITAVTLDEVKMNEFFKQFPLASKASRRVDDENPAADLNEEPKKETAAERLQRELDEQTRELPDEVQ